MDALPRIVWHLDDPVADPALVPLYFVAKKAAEHVTVVLSGEGADEFFGGYAHLPRAAVADAGHVAARPAAEGPAGGVARSIPEGVKGKSFLERGTTPLDERYYGNARIFTEEEKPQPAAPLRPVGAATPTSPRRSTPRPRDLDDVTQMQYIDLFTWLRGDILVKADRMSMAHSLEVRVPFLDRGVFDVAPDDPAGAEGAAALRRTSTRCARRCSGVVPPPIVNRPKLGFPTPTRVWLAGVMYDWARDILAASAAGDLLDLAYVAAPARRAPPGEADHSRKVWTVLVFCVWHAIFVERTLDPGISRNQSALLTKPVVGSMVA